MQNHTTTTHSVTKNTVTKIFDILLASNPNPKTELVYPNHYCLLVAVVLSAQATDIAVNKATNTLFTVANNPYAMLKLGEQNLISHIKSIGLFNAKAKNIIALSQQLITKYHGKIPNTLEELQDLPGVGRKTANVILNTAFNQPTIAVDTHVARLAPRLGLSKASSPLCIEQDLLKIIPKKYLHVAHNLLILHGRYVCKAKKPLCTACKINSLCPYFTEQAAPQ